MSLADDLAGQATDSRVLRLLTQAALVDARTDALDRVFTPLDWHTWDGEYPVIIVRFLDEDSESLGRAAPQFNTVSVAQLISRVETKGGTAFDAGLKAEAALERLKFQQLRAVINHPWIMPRLQQYPYVRSKMGFSSEGERHIAELTQLIGMEFYQGPEDFYPLDPAPFTDMRLNDPAVFTDPAPTPPEVEADIPIPQS